MLLKEDREEEQDEGWKGQEIRKKKASAPEQPEEVRATKQVAVDVKNPGGEALAGTSVGHQNPAGFPQGGKWPAVPLPGTWGVLRV